MKGGKYDMSDALLANNNNIFFNRNEVVDIFSEKNSSQNEINPDLLPIEDANVSILDNLIKQYPNHVAILKGEDIYVTPVLIGDFDLKITRLNSEDFNKSYKIIQECINKTTIELKSDQSELYDIYNSIIDDTEKNNNIYFVLNLFFYLQYNLENDVFQKQISPKYIENPSMQTGGSFFEKIRQMGETTIIKFNELKVLFSSPQDYLIATGGQDIVSNSIGLLGTFTSIETINYFFGMPVNASTIMAMSLIIQTIGARNVISMIGSRKNDIVKILPTCAKKIISNASVARFASYINIDGLNKLMEEYNIKISLAISNQIKSQYAAYCSKKYNETLDMKSEKYETEKNAIIDFQNVQGYLTEDFTKEQVEQIDDIVKPPELTDEKLKTFIIKKPNAEGQQVSTFTEESINLLTNLNVGQRNLIRQDLIRLFPGDRSIITTFSKLPKASSTPQVEKREFKTIECPICGESFRYFSEDGYIHQITSEDNLNDPNIVFKNKLNIFPCKQIILSLTQDQKLNPGYIFNSEYDGVENGGKLMCSNCCLTGLNSLDPGTWPLYFGQERDNTKISIDLVKDLIKDLSPLELIAIDEDTYNKNRLSLCKHIQINDSEIRINKEMQIIKQENPDINNELARTSAIDRLIILNCPNENCNATTIGRFYGIYNKKDINLLYLHCNACGTNFNGCDFKAPYLISKKQFLNLLQAQDVCSFIKEDKLKERRADGLVKVSMDKYKKMKTYEIRSKWSKKSQEMSSLNIKKCPNCNIINDLLEGCSAIVCSSCRETYCYVCSQKVGHNNRGHDTNHFLTGLNDGECPLGGWYSLQCINVNFTIVDPDGNRGVHSGYQQTINGNSTQILPNEEYKLLTRNTWKRYLYLHEKYTNLYGLRDNPNLVDERLCRGDGIWPKINSVYYNTELDAAYEAGDLRIDPDRLVNNEVSEFEEKCNLGQVDRIVNARDVENGDDIEEYVDAPNLNVDPPNDALDDNVEIEENRNVENEAKPDDWVDLEDEDFELNMALLNGLVNNGAAVLANNNINREDMQIIQQIIDAQEREEQIMAEEEAARQREAEENARQERIREEQARQEEINRRLQMDLDFAAALELAEDEENLNEEVIEHFPEPEIPIHENFQELQIDEEERLINEALEIELQHNREINQSKYDLFLKDVDERIAQINLTEEEKNLLIQARGIILKNKEENVLLNYEINKHIEEMINWVVINRTIISSKKFNVTHICVCKNIFNKYVLCFKNERGIFLEDDATFIHQSYCFGEKQCMEMTLDNLNKFVMFYNKTAFNADWVLPISRILSNPDNSEFLFNYIKQQNGGNKKSNKKNTKKYKQKKLMRTNKKNIKRKTNKTIKHKKIKKLSKSKKC
jgi:hypothetical protein